MIKKIFFLLALFLAPTTGFAAATLEDYISQMKDSYNQNYEIVSGKNRDYSEVDQRTFAKLSDQMQMPQDVLIAVLRDQNCKQGVCSPEIEALLEELCAGQKQLTLQAGQCRTLIRNRYFEVKERIAFGIRQEQYAQASQLFVNGTLQDTNGEFFDIVVDLNIIDALLFGDHATVPDSQSPFTPAKDSDTNSSGGIGSGGNTGDSGNNSGDSGENTQDETSDITDDLDENSGENSNPNTSGDSDNSDEDSGESQNPLEEFCRDPEALYFLDSNKNSSSSNSETNTSGENSDKNSSENTVVGLSEINSPLVNFSPSDRQLGNFFTDDQSRYGGKYPDSKQFENDGCGEGKDGLPFLNGRICIPEFCNDLFCVVVTMKPGYRKVPLRNIDCVECHIDRANEALAPLVAEKGKNTPNSNPIEPYFLSAFANLFRGTGGIKIDIKYKKLPFLVYDTPLSKQKKEKSKAKKQTPEEKKESEEARKKFFLERNNKILDFQDPRCPEIGEVFSSTANATFLNQYCLSLQEEKANTQSRMTISEYEASAEEIAEENRQKSEVFHNIIQPFFGQMSLSMVTINSHILDVTPAGISQNKLSCTTRAK